MSNQNPLKKHFRTPVLYLNLPSGGKYYDGNLTMPENNELPVFSMTAKDEMMMTTPDALMNGQCTASVIESCVPNIKNGFAVPSIDLDAILIAIRIATYGENMDFATQCPECNETNDYIIDLRPLLDEINDIDYSEPIVIDDIKVFLKPVNYKDINKHSIKSFKQEQLLNTATDHLPEDEQLKIYNDGFKEIAELSLEIITDNISYIEMDNEKVTSVEFISEYLDNCDNSIYKKIQKSIAKLGENISTRTRNLDVTCGHCEAKHVTPITFETSNFFG